MQFIILSLTALVPAFRDLLERQFGVQSFQVVDSVQRSLQYTSVSSFV